MISVGQKLPHFSLEAVVSTDLAAAFRTIGHDSYPGKWLVLFSYPKDFTFVCPTELKGFGDLGPQFAERDAQLLSLSTDSAFVHLAWRKDHADLRALPYPMLSDIRRDFSSQLGILDEDERVCQRATFIVDPSGVVRYAAMNDPSVGRNPDEVLRVLDALQTGELCACNWQPGQEPVKVG